MKPTLLELVILGLAVFRVDRLIREDTITESLRERTVYRLSETSRLRELLSCGWCLSIWLGAAAVGSFILWPVVVIWLAFALAVSAISGLIATFTP